ncbi:MAG: Nif3-like dinuclear metal center hexameric protein [Saprospirales bacterium]|nr:Nif3-like dinuclear metal center hexameric protein [Saprospirales bacterium]
MKIAEIIQTIENFAPISYQENYDNAGLIIGDKLTDCTGVLICLDSIEAVVDEAIAKNCNLIVAHHPIIFSGLKKINGKNYIERTIIKAIKNDIAIYACHTNIDNVRLGVSDVIAEKLNLKNRKILEPKKSILKKLFTYIPTKRKDDLLNALFAAGAGNIGNYSECSFSVEGNGTFKPNELANPVVGENGIRSNENEAKIEVIFPYYLESKIIQTLKANHPYEEVAFEIISLDNAFQDVGSGMIGDLENEMDEMQFLSYLKEKMNTQCIRYTSLLNKPIKTVAVCGGAGSFLLNHAISQKADVFITGDFKYHQFFDADNQLIICDIGHYESEQFTSQLFNKIISEKFPNFAVQISTINTNPVNYI